MRKAGREIDREKRKLEMEEKKIVSELAENLFISSLSRTCSVLGGTNQTSGERGQQRGMQTSSETINCLAQAKKPNVRG